jgi:hypothetical protein
VCEAEIYGGAVWVLREDEMLERKLPAGQLDDGSTNCNMQFTPKPESHWCEPGGHQWVSKLQSTPDLHEWATYCKLCGAEYPANEPEPQVLIAEAIGQNPHYKPPIMRWNQVELIADEGTQFGIECDSSGLLSVMIRFPGKSWPHNRKEPMSGLNTIEPGNVCYVVSSDERGPAVGHEFMRSSSPLGGCAICNGEVNPVEPPNPATGGKE